MRFRLVVIGLLTFLVAALGVAGTAAASPEGALADRMTPVDGISVAEPSCPYPYVCFYKNGTRTGMFQDVTTYYQTLTSSRAADEVYNTRNDDVAWLLWEDGVHDCIPPHGWYVLQTSPHYVVGIKIRPENNCSVET